MSQLVNTLSLDEQHQRRRRAILATTSSSASAKDLPPPPPLDPSQRLRAPSNYPSSFSTPPTSPGISDELLEEFELTCSSVSPDYGKLIVGFNDYYQQSAPLRAGLRGFVHGMVGGVTSMVTQPIHGAREDGSLGVSLTTHTHISQTSLYRLIN